jgi:bifunctional DNA-binding transcriptional regulator/antitoxin component of YhaV-PrlF toxin-antitoxin module
MDKQTDSLRGTAIVQANNRITIDDAICKTMGIKAGDTVEYEITKVVRKPESQSPQ